MIWTLVNGGAQAAPLDGVTERMEAHLLGLLGAGDPCPLLLSALGLKRVQAPSIP